MTLERWSVIEESVQEEELTADIEGGHDEESSGSDLGPAEEADELSPGYGQELGEAAGIGQSELEIGAAPGVLVTPQEVEGFEIEGLYSEQGPAGEQEVEAIEALESVFGRDDRVRVWNTRAYPFRTISHLYIVARNGRLGG